MRTRRPALLVLGATVAVAAVVAALWPDGSDGGSTPSAATTPVGQAGQPVTASVPAAGLERYVVVPEQSQARYRVGETFLRFNRPNVAVGVTRAISGEIFLDPQEPARSRLGVFTVDISRLQSDEPRRDQAIRERWLESARFPTARFEATSLEGLPETYREGEPVQVTLHGRLTIRDVTRPVTFQGSFELEEDTLRGTARTTIHMTDFGFEPPSIAGLLRANDEVQIEVDIVARPGRATEQG